MDYTRIYQTLCERARHRKIIGYVERHHILPVCLGGTDDADNLIDLTAREHFIAHQLLTRIHRSHRDLAYAAWMMRGRINSAKGYEWLRKHLSLLAKGMTLSPEAKANHLAAMQSQEVRDKISMAAKGRPAWNKGIDHLSDDAKACISESSKKQRGKPKPEGHGAAVAKARTGTKLSEAHKAAIRAAHLKRLS